MITVRFLYYNWFGIIPDDYTEGNKNMIQAIVLLVFLIFLNSVFAGAEMAVLSMNEAKMKELAEEGDHRAQILIKLTEQPAHFMTAIRVTVTTAGFLQSAFAAEYFAQPMTEALIRSGIDVPQNVLKIVCMIIVTILLSFVSLLFGELVPRRLGMKNPDELSLRRDDRSLAGYCTSDSNCQWCAVSDGNQTGRKRGAGHRGRDPYAAYRGK